LDGLNGVAAEPRPSLRQGGTLPNPYHLSRGQTFAGSAKPRVEVVIAVCLLTVLCLLSLILGVPPRFAALAWGGALLVGACFLSSQVGVAVSILAVTLFRRDQLFTASLPVYGGGLKPTDILLVATLAGWAMRQLLIRRSTWAPVPVLALSLAFVAWGGVSAVSGIYHGAAYKDSLLELRPLLQYTLIVPILTEFSPVDIRRLCRLFLVAALVVASKALYLYLRGEGSEASYTGGAIRIMEVGFSPLLIGTLMALAFYVGSERHRLAYALVSLITLLGLAVTMQRSAFLALPISLLAMTYLLSPRHRLRLAAGVALVCVLVVGGAAATSVGSVGKTNLLSAVTGRFLSIADFGEDVSAQHRLHEWTAALAIVRRHPVTGGGLGTRVGFYSPMYGEVRQRMGYWSADIYMHNSYMWVLTKMGIVGLGCLLALLVATVYEVLSVRRYSERNIQAFLSAGLFATLAVFVIASFFGPMFNEDVSTPVVAFTIGGLCVLARRTSTRLTGG
jgi:O-antigen ligase